MGSDILGAEVGDLRSWTTLPKNIQYYRANNLTPGKHTVTVTYPGGSQKADIELVANQLHVLHITAPK